jgi:hypothetical protein
MKSKLRSVFSLTLLVVVFALESALAQNLPENSQTLGTQIVFQYTNNTLKISFPNAPTNPTTIRQDGRDLLLSFSVITPTFDASALQRSAKQWIEGVSVGYDSLLLRLTPKTRVVKRTVNSQLVLTFSLHADAISTEYGSDSETGGTPTDRQSALRLRLLRGQLLLSNEELAQARARFVSLREVMPERTEAIIGLADVELLAGNWRKSLAYHEQAVAIGGDNIELRQRRQSIERQHAGNAAFSFTERRSDGVSNATPTVFRQAEFRGVYPLSQAWRLNFELNRAHVVTSLILKNIANNGPDSGYHSRSSISAQYDAMHGSTIISSAFFGNNKVGFGISYNRPDDFGFSSANLEIARDNWDYIEGVVSGTLRDRFSAARFQRFTPDLRGTFELGLNRYHLNNVGTLGNSRTVLTELRLNKLVDIKGLSATYRVNGEYFSGTKTDDLPLVDREVHSLSLGYFTQVSLDSNATLKFDGYAGFGKDRYGSSGGLFGATFMYLRGPLELALRLSHAKNIARTAGQTDAATLALTIYF